MIELVNTEKLYQWDTKRKVSTDIPCDQIHFANTAYGKSLDVNVVDGIAYIPDELLQYGENLHVWCFCGSYENGYTKYERVFSVEKRAKPAGYVFTPTEQKTLEGIQKQIGNLDELSTKAKNNIVSAINEIFFSGGSGTGTNGVGIESIEQTTTSTESDGKNIITVTLTNGEIYTFEIRNGAKGADGYTPRKGVDYFDGKDGVDGTNGKDGVDGYTPKRGTDYWTDADKAEIKSYVDTAILGGAW